MVYVSCKSEAKVQFAFLTWRVRNSSSSILPERSVFGPNRRHFWWTQCRWYSLRTEKMLPYIVFARWISRNIGSETREMTTAYQVWESEWLSFLCMDLVRTDCAIKAQLADLKQISPPGSLPKSVQRHNYIRVVPPSGNWLSVWFPFCLAEGS